MAFDLIKQAAEFVAALPPEERAKALRQFTSIVALGPIDAGEVPTLPVAPLAEYLAREIDMPPALICPQLIVPGEITITIGKSGKGKSTMNLHRMMRWSAGLPMFDERPELLVPARGPIRAFVIENEGAAHMFQQKMRDMLDIDAGQLNAEEARLAGENFYVWGDGGYSDFLIDDAKQFSRLRRAIDEVKPDIVFMEPLRGIWTGDENDNSAVANMIRKLQGLAADTGIAIVLSHHERKSGAGDGGDLLDAARGASSLDGAIAVMENFREVGGDFRELSWSKARYGGRPADPVRMRWNPESTWYELVEDGDDEAAIIDLLSTAAGDPLTEGEICESLGETGCATGAGWKRVTRLLKQLQLVGRVAKRPRGHGRGLGWILTSTDAPARAGMEF